jgi:hypothetical protein
MASVVLDDKDPAGGHFPARPFPPALFLRASFSKTDT